ncbi:MAG TPA: dihydrodipicolinate synthase family protein [Bryobacteraceae bacterium]|nr:dihydrodipicolinate synthase family protein [Bryobacteraceae bacterium]
MTDSLQPLYAAVLVPRDDHGELNESAFCTILEFLLSRGITGVVVNGATGEYCLTSRSDVDRLLTLCRDVLGDRAQFLCSVGAASIQEVLALSTIAGDHAAAALLLPMPYFFPYSQDDLRSFATAVAAEARRPVLLYNLPRFTSGLEPATVADLIGSAPNIAGIKDSGGTLEIFKALEGSRARRFVGDDSILVEAFEARVCEGAISGIAGVLPELTRFLACRRGAAGYGEAARLQVELIEKLAVFPTPWGLKLIAECRGLAPARFAQPVSEARRRQMEEFRAWFAPWWCTAAAIVE